MRIANFNVQNLRLRSQHGVVHLDGARDSDMTVDTGPGALALDEIDRQLTAAVLRDADADVVALQEVFDQATLDWFHDHVLLPLGVRPYPYRVCLPGNDGRGRDVALISRRPLNEVTGHAALTPSDLGLTDEDIPGRSVASERPIFRRDCLTVVTGGLALFLCHFKAPYPDETEAWAVRHMEALAVRRLIERRFPDPEIGHWLIIGDFNEPARSPDGYERAIAPLLAPFAVDLLERLPEGERWTYFDLDSGLYSRPDALLASPQLAHEWPMARPVVLREGLGRETGVGAGPRLPDVGDHRPHASDHAALVIDFPGL